MLFNDSIGFRMNYFSIDGHHHHEVLSSSSPAHEKLLRGDTKSSALEPRLTDFFPFPGCYHHHHQLINITSSRKVSAPGYKIFCSRTQTCLLLSVSWVLSSSSPAHEKFLSDKIKSFALGLNPLSSRSGDYPISPDNPNPTSVSNASVRFLSSASP